MSQRQIRRKRRPRFQKPDKINIILGSLAIILLFAWGGLYWKESSSPLIVSAEGAAKNQYAELQADGLELVKQANTNKTGGVKPAATDLVNKPSEQTTTQPDTSANEAGASNEKIDQPIVTDKESTPVETTKPSTTQKPSATPKPDQGTVSKPGKGSGTGTGTGVKPTPDIPDVTETKPPVSASEKYEQEIIQVQAKCTQDMNEVLAGADASIKALDMSDPYAFQQLNQKWMDGLTKAESDCTTKFEGIVDRAEKDEVDTDITEAWEQKFSTLMLQLQGDFEAKLLTLMGG